MAVAGTAVATALAALAQHWFGLLDLSLVFMLAVLVVASRARTGPALATAVLCFLAYNFFFIEPRYTFYIDSWHGVVTVGLFLAAALIAGRLASRLASRVQALDSAQAQAIARQELSGRLLVAADEEAVLAAAHAAFQRTLAADVWLRLGERGLHAAGVQPPQLSVLRQVASAGVGETVAEFGWWFLPLRAPAETLGVIGLKLPGAAETFSDEERQLARAMADDITQALLRVRLVADLQGERLSSERERLRSALLSSVSHDLRSPLAAIIGAAGSLETYADTLSREDRQGLLDAIRIEGQRLDRYIQNLLDMTRLEHATPVLRRDWIGVDELVGAAVQRLRAHQPRARFALTLAPHLGPLHVQPALFEQALFNVLDNAAKHAPTDEAIVIAARRLADDTVEIDVSDRGPGVPEAERDRVFDLFHRLERGDRASDGTGLGLAICRGILRAHGGEALALAGADGVGTTLRLRLPPAPATEAPPP